MLGEIITLIQEQNFMDNVHGLHGEDFTRYMGIVQDLLVMDMNALIN